MNCKHCKLTRENHGSASGCCLNSNTTYFEPESPSADEWLDAPSGDGWWWRYVSGWDEPELAWVHGEDCLIVGESSVLSRTVPAKWQRAAVKPHSPVPKPLPKAKTVELTAKVTYGGTCWSGWVYLSDKENPINCYTPANGPENAKRDAVQWVRDTYGIEPSVEEP